VLGQELAGEIEAVGRAEVTCVDSQEKLDMLRALGADHVLDYAREDFTKRVEAYDAIIDVVGKSPYSGSLRSLKENGCYILGNPRLSGMNWGSWTSRGTSKQVIFETANDPAEDFARLNELVQAGKMKPVIDRRYPLERTAEEHRYVDEGHKKGKVIITVG
jgi:NADPH:quinone reductase-like Zn-dependent oxidoreductase